MAFFKNKTDEQPTAAQHMSIDQVQMMILDAVTSQFGDSRAVLPDFSVVSGWATADFIAFRSFDVQVRVGMTPEDDRDINRLKVLVAIGPRFVALTDLLATDVRDKYQWTCTEENLAADMTLLEQYLSWRLTPEQRAKFEN